MQRIPRAYLLDEFPSSEKPIVPSSHAPAHKASRQNLGSPTLKYIFEELRREIGLRNDSAENNLELSSSELNLLLYQVATRLGFELSVLEKDEILVQIEKEQKPFGILQELVDDPSVTDIIVTHHQKVSVQLGRVNFSTDLCFPSQDSYEAFVERLLSKAATTYSTKKPIADGMIGSFARIHAVHKALCDIGPYLTIRLNRFSTVSVEDLRRTGLAPREILDYLCTLVKGGFTVLIAGEVGTGKTTLARAVGGTVAPQESILVIEDTPEIRLDHPNVRYLTTREANIDGAGRVSPAECIRAGMRMAMNRIIFGEIRDAEAAEAFIDVCASGHPGLSTVHARSAIEAVARLELFLGRAQKGVDSQILKEQVATAVQIIVHTGICRESSKRRILEVKEIGPVADGVLRQRDIFVYQPQRGIARWKVAHRVSAHRDVLESAEMPVILSSLPGYLELDLDIVYKEAASQRTR